MSIFILQLPVAQQSFAAFNPWILLLLIQVFQLVDVILALGLALLQVDIREDSLDYGDLKTQTSDSERLIASLCDRSSCSFTTPKDAIHVHRSLTFPLTDLHPQEKPPGKC